MNDGFDIFYGYAQKRDEYSDIVVGGHSSTEAENPRPTTYSTAIDRIKTVYTI